MPAAPATPEPATPAPRSRWRRWRLGRWFLVVMVGFVGYGAWREYDFRMAIQEAQALGWEWEYDDPIEAIRKHWKAAFRKATWTDGQRTLVIRNAAKAEGHAQLIRRLGPKWVRLMSSPELRDLAAFKGLSTLVTLDLSHCTGLKNVDALKGLPALRSLDLRGCTHLSAEAIEELEVSLPNTKILPYP